MRVELLMSLASILALGMVAAAQEPTDSLGDSLPQGAVQRLGTLRMKYTAGVSDLRYLPDGRGVVAVGGRIDIWDLAAGELEVTYQVSAASVGCMQVSKDGNRLLFRAGGDVLEWSLSEQKELHKFPTNQAGFKWAFYSPDETRVLTTGTTPPTVKEFELATGKELIAIDGSDDVATFYKAVYGPGGKTAFVGAGYDQVVCHYDLTTGEKLKQFLGNYCAYDLCLSPDEERLLVGSRSYASEWKIDGYEELKRFGGHHGGAVNSVAYCHEPEQILTGSRDGSIRRWNREEAKVLLRWFPHESYVTIQRVSPDGQRVLSYGAGLVAESDLATGEPRIKWERHAGAVNGVAFLADGQHVVSGSADGTLRLWDVTTGATVRVIKGANLGAWAVAVSPDGAKAAAGCKDGMLREFDLADGSLIRELTGHLGYVRSVAYSHDGSRLISSADDGSVRVWTTESEEPVAVLQGHRGGVLAVAVSSDDKLVLSGGRDGTVRVWDLARQEELQKLEGHRGWVDSVTFAAGGRYALSGGRDGRLIRWNLESGKLADEMPQGAWLKTLATSPDGAQAYAAGDDRTVVRWDLANCEQVGTFKGHQGAVYGVAVSPDGKLLVSASADTTLLVWNLQQQ